LFSADIPKWKRDYLNSCNKFIIAETLSPTFVGMTFSKVAEICYVKLNLLLLAIEARKYEGGNISINPKNKEIQPNAIGNSDCFSSDLKNWFELLILGIFPVADKDD
jgi:potassium large conductance calcium-activated channel subfamily M alpha protein 1